MFLKRTSPNLVPLAGSLEIGDKKSFQAEIVPLGTTKKQQKPSGYCVHDALKPIFYTPPVHHKKRPGIIEEAKSLLENAYHKPKKILAKLFHNKKKKKSSRREAIIRVLQVMLQYLDMETLEIGFYDNSSTFVRLDVNYIARQANIAVIRAKRALSDIMKAGYLEAKRQFKQDEDKRYFALTSIRKFTVAFFMELGIGHFKFFSAREWKRKKNEKHLLKQGRGKLKRIIQSVIKLSSKASNKDDSLLRKTLQMIEEASKALQHAALYSQRE